MSQDKLLESTDQPLSQGRSDNFARLLAQVRAITTLPPRPWMMQRSHGCTLTSRVPLQDWLDSVVGSKPG